MKGLDNSLYLILYIISNVIALILLFAAWKAPKLARLLFFLLFAWASYKNMTVVIRSPQSYLDYADFTFLDMYKQFISGWFSKHIATVIALIATCQALIAISMLLKNFFFKIGAVGAIVFLIAIAPLGVGAAFPCTVIMAIALIVILSKQSTDNYGFI